MTTTEQKQKQEMVLPSFFYAIASSESRQLISLDELQRIITLDAMTQARTEDYRKNMRISSELAHQTSKHPTPMTIQLHPQCLLGIQGILRNWTFLIFKQV